MSGLRLFYALLLCSRLAAAQTNNAERLLNVQDAINRGDLKTATSLLESELKNNPDNDGFLNLRGVVYAQQGDYHEAQRDFSRAVQLNPHLVPAWRNLARSCQLLSNNDSAEKQCAEDSWQRVLRASPSDGEALRGLAMALQRSGKFTDSLQALNKAPQDKAFRTADSMIRCLDLSGLKRNPEAFIVAKQLASDDEFAEGDLLAMSGAGPRVTEILAEALDARSGLNIDGLKQLAVAYAANNKLPEARKTLERLINMEPRNAAHLIEAARVAERQKDHEAALGYLGHARELTPDDGQVHYLFGMIAAEMDLPVEARRSFDRALEIAPGNPDYNYAIGAVILTTRDAAKAGAYFAKYVELKPADARGHYALGVAEYTSGDFDNAKKQLTSVAQDHAVGGAAEFFLGRLARLEGDLHAAKQHLAKAVTLMPKFAESHTELARVAMLEDQLDSAAAELKLALQLDARSFQANSQLLVLYKRTHNPREADQSELMKKLDEERSRRAELMLRTVEIRP